MLKGEESNYYGDYGKASRKSGCYHEKKPYISFNLWYRKPGVVVFFPAEDKAGKLWLDDNGTVHFSVYKEGTWEKEMSSQQKLETGQRHEIGIGIYDNRSFLFVDWNQEDWSIKCFSDFTGEVFLEEPPEKKPDNVPELLPTFKGEVQQFKIHEKYPPPGEPEGETFSGYPWQEVLLNSFLVSGIVSLALALWLWLWFR